MKTLRLLNMTIGTVRDSFEQLQKSVEGRDFYCSISDFEMLNCS